MRIYFAPTTRWITLLCLCCSLLATPFVSASQQPVTSGAGFAAASAETKGATIIAIIRHTDTLKPSQIADILGTAIIDPARIIRSMLSGSNPGGGQIYKR